MVVHVVQWLMEIAGTYCDKSSSRPGRKRWLEAVMY